MEAEAMCEDPADIIDDNVDLDQLGMVCVCVCACVYVCVCMCVCVCVCCPLVTST